MPSTVDAEPFQRFIAIDFSAANAPTLGENSLWTAWCDGDGRIFTRNTATRAQLLEELTSLLQTRGRVLVVLDVALGWPAGLASALSLRGTPFVATGALLEELLRDNDHNVNNRFEVANELNQRADAALFWGHPPGRQYSHLSPTKRPMNDLAASNVADRRLIERRVGGVIKSPFQLSGAGAVGSQSLVAQLFLRRLRRAGAEFSIWPFEPDPTKVIVAEYFFSLAKWRDERGATTDERQVRAVVRWLRERQRRGEVTVGDELLAALSARERRTVQREEGWLAGFSAH